MSNQTKLNFALLMLIDLSTAALVLVNAVNLWLGAGVMFAATCGFSAWCLAMMRREREG